MVASDLVNKYYSTNSSYKTTGTVVSVIENIVITTAVALSQEIAALAVIGEEIKQLGCILSAIITTTNH